MKSDKVPKYRELIVPTYKVLLALGGSGTNTEITEGIIEMLNLPNSVIEVAHLGSLTQTELNYQLAWARTYLKNYGVITNSGRSIWTLKQQYSDYVELDVSEIVSNTSKLSRGIKDKIKFETPQTEEVASNEPLEVKSWRNELAEILYRINPFDFERLSQRLLRECGFDDVQVTKKTGDGGIDGTGKLRINGIFSFSVAFQCKRYKGSVSSSEIRNFRGSLSTDIEKGVFITTGKFTRDAVAEAYTKGKKQIDLIDGEEFINKLAQYEIGLKEVRDYEIDYDFFKLFD